VYRTQNPDDSMHKLSIVKKLKTIWTVVNNLNIILVIIIRNITASSIFKHNSTGLFGMHRQSERRHDNNASFAADIAGVQTGSIWPVTRLVPCDR